jgi:hypothetical protein
MYARPSYGQTRHERLVARVAAKADRQLRREGGRLARKERRDLGLKGAPLDWEASTTIRQEPR